MAQFVPATTRVRRKSIPNIPTERLARRRFHLIHVVIRGKHAVDRRRDFYERACECALIEDELARRGEVFIRASLPPEQRGHVVVSIAAELERIGR